MDRCSYEDCENISKIEFNRYSYETCGDTEYYCSKECMDLQIAMDVDSMKECICCGEITNKPFSSVYPDIGPICTEKCLQDISPYLPYFSLSTDAYSNGHTTYYFYKNYDSCAQIIRELKLKNKDYKCPLRITKS